MDFACQFSEVPLIRFLIEQLSILTFYSIVLRYGSISASDELNGVTTYALAAFNAKRCVFRLQLLLNGVTIYATSAKW